MKQRPAAKTIAADLYHWGASDGDFIAIGGIIRP
ncbi:hypothetical protein FHW16_005233 [Phyllobacterium myrsinacearum]|uniref:Uncharacterized protein n=1 Tax=Phyllobacterium myrsinacearum TaxID=28101 RepID=A0A839ERQ3_9HYPH|nr:hypothetical protein [Phyllobacterium myrsinacearum]